MQTLTCWSEGIKRERLENWHKEVLEACRKTQGQTHVNIFESQVNSHQRTSTIKDALNSQVDNDSTSLSSIFCHGLPSVDKMSAWKKVVMVADIKHHEWTTA